MSEAERVFKEAWERRHEKWVEATKGDAGYPTQESGRVWAGLCAVALLIMDKADALPDEDLSLEFARGVTFATKVLTGRWDER